MRKVMNLAVLLLFSVVVMAQNISSPKYEYRAVWLTAIENLDWPKTLVKTPADTLAQQRELTNLLDSLQALNVNTVLLQTRVRGDLIYPSAIEPFSHVFTGVSGGNPGYDPLAFAIAECHKRGMQLHAWVVALPLGKKEHIKRLGTRSLTRTHRALCTYYKDSWYMEPGNPETADYLCRIAEEITTNYAVDGIHLDYIRYPDRTNGYPDTKLHRTYGNGLSLADWRRKNISHIAKRVYSTVKSIKPWVRVSCAPLGKYADLTCYSSYGWNARDAVFQEAQEWLRDGYMDILFPMLYFKDNHFYPFVLDWQENSYGRHIVPGVGIYRLLPEYGAWQPIEIKRQLFTSRSAGTAGTALFRTQHIIESSEAQAVYSSVYPKRALVPPLAWASVPAPEKPATLSVNRVGDTFTLTWDSVMPAAGHPATRYNVYAALGDIVDIENVDNIDNLLCTTTSTSFVWECRTNSAIALAVTAVDAYGRESAPALWNCESSRTAVTNIFLPQPRTWGMRIEVFDIYGRSLYKGRYSALLVVAGLAPGDYLLKIYGSDGRVVDSRYFRR